MNPTDFLLSEPFGQALGWTLLHFVWQGALVALLLALALYGLRRQTAQVRYVVACGAMALLLVLPALTLFLLRPEPVESPVEHLASAVAPTAADAARDVGAAALDAPTAPQQDVASRLTAALPWLVLLWMAGVMTLSVRYLAGWTYTIRLRRRGAREVGQQWQDQLTRLRQQMAVRRTVRLVSSALVQVPTVAGWLRPMILLPVSVFTGLSPRQIEMIIAHELAHIRRHDYLVNLLQAACETVLFYHPAVWWVSQRIRIEREHCCDDLVVSVCGDAITYAAALTKLETVRQTTPRLALAANGGSLLNRVRRLLEGPAEATPGAARWFAGLVVLATLLLSLFLSSAFDGMWNRTHAWIAGNETNERSFSDAEIFFSTIDGASRPQGRLFIHTDDERGVLVESFQDGETESVILKGPGVTVTMPAGARLSVDDEDKPEQGKLDFEKNTITFKGNLTLEISVDDERLSRLTTRAATVVYAMPGEVETSRENLARQPDVSALFGYEKTARLLEQLIFQDGSASVQLEALDKLRVLPHRSVVLPSLINIAERHPRQQVRHEAVQWLGRLGDAFVVLTLERIAFEDQNAAVQMEALDALGTLSDKIGWPSLIKIARTHPRAAMRNEAVQAFGRLGDEAARTTLNYILYTDPDEDVQRETFDALMSLPAGMASRKLKELAEAHPNEDIRQEAADELRERRVYEAEELRNEALRRRDVVRPPQSWGTHRNTAERLEALIFTDESEATQLEALQVLANEPGDAPLPSLKKLAKTHPNEQVREKATHHVAEVEARVQAEQEEQNQWSQALDDLNHEQVSRRIAAVKTLEELPTKNVFSTLCDVALNDPSVEVQREALDALRDRGWNNLGALALLARIIRNHPSAEMRIEAVQSIEEMKAEDRLPLLEEIVFRDDNLGVRAEALDQLIDAPEAEALPILTHITRQQHLPEEIRIAAFEALEER